MSPGSGSLLVKTATDLKETADGNEVDGNVLHISLLQMKKMKKCKNAWFTLSQ